METFYNKNYITSTGILTTCFIFCCTVERLSFHSYKTSLSCCHWARPKVRCIVFEMWTFLAAWSILAWTNLVFNTEKKIQIAIKIHWTTWSYFSINGTKWDKFTLQNHQGGNKSSIWYLAFSLADESTMSDWKENFIKYKSFKNIEKSGRKKSKHV